MLSRDVFCVGLGGIFQGYIKSLLDLHSTGIVPCEAIMLIDGKRYDDHHRHRQYFVNDDAKAIEQWRLWKGHYPAAPLSHQVVYVDNNNVATLIPNGAIVLTAPDNLATRKLLSDHAVTLTSCLLISGGNDVIDEKRQTDGSLGNVLVHYRLNGQDVTAPITRFHPEIAEPDDTGPTDISCEALVRAGAPQLKITNDLVGIGMMLMLERYLTLPVEQATQIVELWMDSRLGRMAPRAIQDRPPFKP